LLLNLISKYFSRENQAFARARLILQDAEAEDKPDRT
jgi:hypothetical protein